MSNDIVADLRNWAMDLASNPDSDADERADARKLSLAASEIETLREEVKSLRIELERAAHNRFFDHRDGYFEGLKDG